MSMSEYFLHMIVLSPPAYFNIYFEDEIVQYPGAFYNAFDKCKAILSFALMKMF